MQAGLRGHPPVDPPAGPSSVCRPRCLGLATVRLGRR